MYLDSQGLLLQLQAWLDPELKLWLELFLFLYLPELRLRKVLLKGPRQVYIVSA